MAQFIAMEIMLPWQQINVSDCATRWATKLFLTKSCAEIIAPVESCYLMVFKVSSDIFLIP